MKKWQDEETQQLIERFKDARDYEEQREVASMHAREFGRTVQAVRAKAAYHKLWRKRPIVAQEESATKEKMVAQIGEILEIPANRLIGLEKASKMSLQEILAKISR